MSGCVACIKEDFESVMEDSVLQLLFRLLGDVHTSTRIELCTFCEYVLNKRLQSGISYMTSADSKIVSLLILSCGEESTEVDTTAYKVSSY